MSGQTSIFPKHTGSSKSPSSIIARLLRAPGLAVALASVLAGGCASYKLDPPTDFVEVHAYSSEVRMKAQDNVGLNLRIFKNVRGGSLSFWGADLVDKLSDRGYVLRAQGPARSANGVVGTRFDFDYTAQGKDTPKFYSAVLFVTDDYRFVLQLAGDKSRESAYSGRIDEISSDIKVRGCKIVSELCKGPQPPSLLRSGPPGPKGPAGDGDPAQGSKTPSPKVPAERAPPEAVASPSPVASTRRAGHHSGTLSCLAPLRTQTSTA